MRISLFTLIVYICILNFTFQIQENFTKVTRSKAKKENRTAQKNTQDRDDYHLQQITKDFKTKGKVVSCTT